MYSVQTPNDGVVQLALKLAGGRARAAVTSAGFWVSQANSDSDSEATSARRDQGMRCSSNVNGVFSGETARALRVLRAQRSGVRGQSDMSVDLDLARGALTGDIEALRAFDALVSSLPVSDDARQAVRHKALVDGRLKEFDGRGALRSWLKTVALRLEVDLQRASREDAVEDRVLDALLPASEHLEAQLVSDEARRLLREAVRHALGGLAPREKLWVQHYHLDGMTLTAIGQLYAVAPSTVMRAIDKSVTRLRALVQEHLRETHQLGLNSLDSLVRAGVA